MKNARAGRLPWIPILLLVAMTLLAYLPVLHAGFIWDDDDYVTHNPVLRSVEGLKRIWFEPDALPQYYPLVHTSYWIEYPLWGLNASGYHLVNLLLHAASVVLLFIVLRKLAFPLPFLAAAVFALHPVHVETVAWITERKNTLSGLFALLALLAWMKWRPIIGIPGSSRGVGASPDSEFSKGAIASRRSKVPPGAGGSPGSDAFEDADASPGSDSLNGSDRSRGSNVFYALALIAFVCALLSKTVTCSLPAVIALLVWWKRGRVDRRTWLALLPMFVIGLVLAMVTVNMEIENVAARGAQWDLSLVERCLIAGRALWFYAYKLLWPAELIFNYTRWNIDAAAPAQYLFPLAAFIVMFVCFVMRKRWGRGPLTGVLVFAGSLVPALGFFNIYPMLYSFVADHFQYLASIGLIVPICRLPHRLFKSKSVHAGIAVLLILLLGALTRQRVRVFESRETLWQDTLDKNPDSWLALVNLGGLRLDQGRIDEATRMFEKAVSLWEPNPDAHNNLGMVYLHKGNFEAAERHLLLAIEQRPNRPGPYNNLGVLYWRRGDLVKAEEKIGKALELAPNYPDANRNMADLLIARKRYKEAAPYLRFLLKRDPDDEALQKEYADLLHAAGKRAK